MAWGGAEYLGVWNYYLNMARVLATHVPHAELCVFYPSGLPAARRREVELTTGNLGAELPPASRRTDIAAIAGRHDREFSKRFAAAGVDVVFEQAKFLGKNFPLPVLSWIGDLQHRSLPTYFSRAHRLQRDVGFRSQVRWRKHVVVSSEAAKSDLLTFIPRPRAEIHVVPFAVQMTTSITETRIAEVRRQYELPPAYLFLPNQLWRHKNHELALRALAILVGRGHRWLLALSGPARDYRHPEYSDHVAGLVAELKIEGHLRWLGTVPYDDLLHLVAGADVLLNPSFFEGWSTTVEEAKALATPMALSALPVHVEQATGSATFFDAMDAAAMADAIEHAARHAPRDREAARREAAMANVRDQEIYAGRLRRALEFAIADHQL